MATKKPSSIVPSGGMLRDFTNRLKLILRLMGDRRVNVFLKVLPLASVAYLIMPADLAPGLVLPVIGALDDAAVLWLGSYLFVELCPPDVVQEHTKALASNIAKMEDNDDVVEGETTEIKDDNKQE